MGNSSSQLNFESIEAFLEQAAPMCAHLLKHSRSVIAGEMDGPHWCKGLDKMKGDLDTSYRQMYKDIKREAEKSGDDATIYLDKFRDAQAKMHKVISFLYALKRGEESKLQEIEKLLLDAALSYNNTAAEYEMAGCLKGPTDMPLVNMLSQAIEAYENCQIERKDFVLALGHIRDMSRTALEEIQRSAVPSQELIDIYEDQLRIFADMERAAGHSAQEVRSLFPQFIEVSSRLAPAYDRFSKAQNDRGDSPDVRINRVVNIARLYEKGKVKRLELVALLEDTLEDYLAESSSVRVALSAGEPSEEVIVEGEKALDSYSNLLEILEDLTVSLKSGEKVSFEKAYAELNEESQKLFAVRDALLEIGESANRVACPRCGQSNVKGSTVCSSCSARLPMVHSDTESQLSFVEGVASGSSNSFGAGEIEVTEHLLELFEAINEVAEEEISLQDFEKVRQKMLARVVAAYEGAPGVPVMTSKENFTEEDEEILNRLRENFEALSKELKEGLVEMERGLKEMAAFHSDRDEAILVDGVKVFHAGALVVQRVEKESRQLQEEFAQYVNPDGAGEK